MINKIVEEDIEYIANYPLDWDKMKHKTILITGANGLLPSYMVRTILYLNDKMSLKCKVVALVRNQEKALNIFKDYIGRDDFHIIVQDVCTDLEFKNKIDFIIHAASQASPIYYKVDPVGTLNANVLGTNNMLSIAYKNKVESFLFFSSAEVYGEINCVPTTEDDYGYLNPTQVRSCYGESKRMGETMCVSWFNQYEVPCKIVRPFHTYGPGINLEDGRVFADFISNIVNNQDIVLKSDGTDMRAFCYLADAIVGFFMVLFSGKNGEAYNIGNPAGEISILGLSQLLVELFPEKSLKVVKSKQNNNEKYLKSEVKRNTPDISKMRDLGWNPKYSISEGFYRTIVSCQMHLNK